MPTIVIRHKVGNFDTWLAGHEDRVMLFSQFGNSFDTYRDMDNPDWITLVAHVTDMEKMQEVMNDPENKKYMDKHTVIEPMFISMPVDV